MDTGAQERTLEGAEEQNPEQLVLAEERAVLVRSTLAQLPKRQQLCLNSICTRPERIELSRGE